MTVTLNNEFLQISFETKGAQLVSLVKGGREYIWQRDEKYWSECAPVLFPMVSAVLDNYFTYKDKKYPLPAHGFAQNCEFEIVNKTDSSALLHIIKTDDIKNIYPFEFDFYVSYALNGGKLDIKYIVKNISKTQDMYFNTGSHEGYNLFSGNTDDYYLEFEKEENLLQKVVYDPVWEGETRDFGKTNILELKEEYFKIDGIFFTDVKSKYVTLKCKKDDASVRVYFDCDKFGVWKAYGSSFLCMEPWDGFCPYKGDSHDIAQKRFIKVLPPEKEYEFNHSIEIL